jgi:hypothetical protein
MRIRMGFVSNSSSASFVINKKHLPKEVIDAIKDHYDYAHKHNFKCIDSEFSSPSDKWAIEETETELRGSTSMDNFDMQMFIEELYDQFELPYFKYERDYW